MSDKPFVPDHPEDWLYLGLAVVAILFFSVFTTLDGQVRAVFRENFGYFSSPAADLTFTEEQINNMNWGSQTSLGFRPLGDERLYCFSVEDKRVSNLRFADRIGESDLASISGTCYDVFGEIDGFVHSQPEGSNELSEEDKDLESDVSFTCIQHDEIVESPTGKVSGLNCWEVEGTISKPEFNDIEVGISVE